MGNVFDKIPIEDIQSGVTGAINAITTGTHPSTTDETTYNSVKKWIKDCDEKTCKLFHDSFAMPTDASGAIIYKKAVVFTKSIDVNLTDLLVDLLELFNSKSYQALAISALRTVAKNLKMSISTGENNTCMMTDLNNGMIMCVASTVYESKLDATIFKTGVLCTGTIIKVVPQSMFRIGLINAMMRTSLESVRRQTVEILQAKYMIAEKDIKDNKDNFTLYNKVFIETEAIYNDYIKEELKRHKAKEENKLEAEQ
ncbi:predicted protein [Naegleria gruberi]|uniref:Predicted protein n=1 Tax=Naegleria gruberi TaxID=5762 RepID=D2VF97_NAEGR|nr:uncharacterized protein NAEGRDRAFT_79727 [Naegleria gruberi]EFC44421.1 predicted protein [Naegleria gruberi]|eukprot:XP_002677165.1 predicted protein [Naegleria gruberi strain NEG-M]